MTTTVHDSTASPILLIFFTALIKSSGISWSLGNRVHPSVSFNYLIKSVACSIIIGIIYQNIVPFMTSSQNPMSSIMYIGNHNITAVQVRSNFVSSDLANKCHPKSTDWSPDKKISWSIASISYQPFIESTWIKLSVSYCVESHGCWAHEAARWANSFWGRCA